MRLLDAVDVPTRAAMAARLARHLSPPLRVVQYLVDDLPDVAVPLRGHAVPGDRSTGAPAAAVPTRAITPTLEHTAPRANAASKTNRIEHAPVSGPRKASIRIPPANSTNFLHRRARRAAPHPAQSRRRRAAAAGAGSWSCATPVSASVWKRQRSGQSREEFAQAPGALTAYLARAGAADRARRTRRADRGGGQGARHPPRRALSASCCSSIRRSATRSSASRPCRTL